ncbi:N-acylethanolamine-hydrolyzing acid amidase-like [Sycon ciliatum]|uniref:N-acylethanolamine-hydrolyzing acid amidase-like n=1 Tax=Sycon ciliatum TaxID=27933 RepID=UPI0020A979C1|eukprot:scpid21914/ scgid16166/ N-acylethanolamine-hydrolyzing acid amidase; N-acylsphingosine amidohydrolase-like
MGGVVLPTVALLASALTLVQIQAAVAVATSVASLNPGPPGPVAPTYNLSLDDAPEQRWTHILKHFTGAKQAIIDYFAQQVHSKEEQAVLNDIGANLDKYLGDLGREMKGVAQVMDVDVGTIVMLNFGYELRHLGPGRPNTTGNATMNRETFHPAGACTSIVVQSQDYSIIHGRNLDWNLPDELRHLIIQINVLRGGDLLFTGTGVAGFVGFLNGVTYNGFSGSINERLLGGSIVLDALQAIKAGSNSPTHLLRKLLMEQLSYPEAVTQLMDQPLTAPVYYIVAGVARDEGAVITRDRVKVDDVWQLQSHSSASYSWYLLETNYDHWREPVAYDNRRKYGNEYMTQLGRQSASTYDGLVSVLNTWPVRNNETTWTSLMSAKTGHITTYVVYL